MILRKLAMAAVGAVMAVVPAVASPAVASAAPQSSAKSVAVKSVAVQAVTITVSGGGEYSSYVGQATQVWNQSVPNIRMVQVSGNGNIRISVGSGGGSRASIGHGSGWIYLDRLQINQGYSPLRVITHEIGHSLGLRDNYNGNCSILMSGGSAGTGCRNVWPSRAEANWVNQSFAYGYRTARATGEIEWSTDSWPTPATRVAAA